MKVRTDIKIEYESSGMEISCILVDTGSTWAAFKFSAFRSGVLYPPYFAPFDSPEGLEEIGPDSAFNPALRLLSPPIPVSLLESFIRLRALPSASSLFTLGDCATDELSSIFLKKSLRAARIFLWHAMDLRSEPVPATIRQSANTGFLSKLPISSLKLVGLLLLFSSATLWKISIAPSPIHFFVRRIRERNDDCPEMLLD
mmetsp:Transcript_5948/g.14412  ORF Transcript_5948/g.14412 Transcript_5948/m.14412 type:complete len:200 (+) Transcript_5948:608-1207(+)